MKTARVIITRRCDRDCEGCCNKNWVHDPPIKIKPIVSDLIQLAKYDEIILTGGEPMLNEITTLAFILTMNRVAPISKKIMYTALAIHNPYEIYKYLDGVTFTLHEQKDVASFMHMFVDLQSNYPEIFKEKVMRLNIFKGVNLPLSLDDYFKIKSNITWIKDCPLPENEVLYELI